MDSKKVFFSEGGVSVSNQRFIANGRIFDLTDIQSVHLDVVEPKRKLAIFSILIGVGFLLSEGVLFVGGGFCISVGVLAWIFAKTRYTVSLRTATDKHRALFSHDRTYIETIIHALDTALINRIDPRDSELLSLRRTSGQNKDMQSLMPPWTE